MFHRAQLSCPLLNCLQLSKVSLYNECNYLSMLGLKLKHGSKMAPDSNAPNCTAHTLIQRNLHGRVFLLTFEEEHILVVGDKGVDHLRLWSSTHHILFPKDDVHGPGLTRYVKMCVVHVPGMPETFSPPPRVSDPDMHHGTCVTHVP